MAVTFQISSELVGQTVILTDIFNSGNVLLQAKIRRILALK